MAKAKAITPEHLPPAKAAKPHDTETARIAATNILTWHVQAESGAKIALTAAVMIGATMQKMKNELPHGSFRRWQEKYLKPIPQRTRTRYMGMVSSLGKLQPNKWATVAHLLPSKCQEVTEREIKTVSNQVHSVLDGKHLSELYREYGLVKPRQTKSEKAHQRRKKKALETGLKGDELSAELWGEDVVDKLSHAHLFREFLSDDMLNAVAEEIVKAWTALGLPPIVTGGDK